MDFLLATVGIIALLLLPDVQVDISPVEVFISVHVFFDLTGKVALPCCKLNTQTNKTNKNMFSVSFNTFNTKIITIFILTIFYS